MVSPNAWKYTSKGSDGCSRRWLILLLLSISKSMFFSALILGNIYEGIIYIKYIHNAPTSLKVHYTFFLINNQKFKQSPWKSLIC